MSARDDYQLLFRLAQETTVLAPEYANEAGAAIDEIDHLRGDVSKLLAKLATTGASWP